MAGGGEGLGAPQRERKGHQSKRKKKKRIGFKLDMTPLVDITFLLLTFFMFTTTMLKPQIMEMKLPPEWLVEVEVKASELFTINLTEDGKLWWYVGVAAPENPPQELQFKDLKAKAVELNLKPNVRNRLITVFKIAENAKYEYVIKVLDELNMAEIPVTEEIIKDKDPKTGEVVKRSRKFTIAPLTEADLKILEELKK
jgi:biopolymer transport protein ExbD